MLELQMANSYATVLAFSAGSELFSRPIDAGEPGDGNAEATMYKYKYQTPKINPG